MELKTGVYLTSLVLYSQVNTNKQRITRLLGRRFNSKERKRGRTKRIKEKKYIYGPL